MKRTTLKLAVLIISMMQPIITAANSVLADIQKTYPNISENWIMQLVSLPFLLTIPATILTGKLAEKIDKKKLLLFGIALSTVAGLLPIFLDGFTPIMISRLFVGIGVGIVIPFMTSLIADYFEGHERDNLFGLQGTFVNMGSITYYLIGGLLGAISWRMNFYVFIIGFIIFLITLRFLPKQQTAEQKQSVKAPLVKEIFIFGFTMCVITILGYSFNAHLSFVISADKMGNAATAGIITTFFSLGGLLSGFYYGIVYRIVKSYTTAFSVAILGIGVVIGSLTYSTGIMMAAAFFTGTGMALTIAAFLSRVAATVPKESVTIGMAVILSSVSLGIFVTPTFASAVKVVFTAMTYRGLFGLCAALLFLGAFISLLLNLRKQRLLSSVRQ